MSLFWGYNGWCSETPPPVVLTPVGSEYPYGVLGIKLAQATHKACAILYGLLPAPMEPISLYFKPCTDQ